MADLTGEEWKEEVKVVDASILEKLRRVVCDQTSCFGQGRRPDGEPGCATCADIAENVVGEFLRLSRTRSA